MKEDLNIQIIKLKTLRIKMVISYLKIVAGEYELKQVEVQNEKE